MKTVAFSVAFSVSHNTLSVSKGPALWGFKSTQKYNINEINETILYQNTLSLTKQTLLNLSEKKISLSKRGLQ